VTPDRDYRQGEKGIQAPSFYRDSTDAQLAWIDALVRRVADLEAKLAAAARKNSDLELRLRGVPFRSA
jgi:hypothetical protein